MTFLRQHIKHVIYLEKENRTYDQILGDLPIGNGDPSLTDFGKAITPSYHAIVQQRPTSSVRMSSMGPWSPPHTPRRTCCEQSKKFSASITLTS